MAVEFPVIVSNNFVDASVITRSTQADGFNASNVSGWRPYTRWKPTGLAPAWIEFDFGSAKSINTLVLGGHDFLANGVTYKLDKSNTGAFAGEEVPVLSAVAATTNTLIYIEFPVETERHWRLTLTAFTAPPSIGIIVLATRFTFTKFLNSPFSGLPERAILGTTRSQRGHVLGRSVQYTEHSVAPRWKFYPAADYDTFKTEWDARLFKEPFIWVWDPGNHPLEVVLVQTKDGMILDPVLTAATRRLQLDLVGVKGV